MSITKTILYSLALLLLTPALSMAQDTDKHDSISIDAKEKTNSLNVSLDLFSHGEMRSGGYPENATDDRANFLSGRERLIIGYERKELEVNLNIQHSDIWGEAGGGSFDVYEAWAKLRARNGLFLKVGRQALAYDDERIIGPNDWAMASQSHDVLLTGYEGKGHKVHMFFAYNQNPDNADKGGNYYADGFQPYKTMQTAWYHYDIGKFPLGFSVLFMNIGMQGGSKDEKTYTAYQQLAGGYAKYSPEHLTIEGAYYRQMGKNEDKMKIRAWMASAKATVKPTEKYGFEAGYDYLSGDKYFAVPPKGEIGLMRHKVIKGFNSVYGSHHKFYGMMDFFYVSTYVNGFTPGLQNLYAGVFYNPIKNLSLKADYHYLAIAADLDDMDKKLGHEIEFEAKYYIKKDICLSAGFSYMTGTETMEKLKRANENGNMKWGWISLEVSPRIFSTKW